MRTDTPQREPQLALSLFGRKQIKKRRGRTGAIALTLAGSLTVQPGVVLGQWLEAEPVQAQTTPFCIPEAAIAQKESLRRAALTDDQSAKIRYQDAVRADVQRLRQCRNQNWPQTQAIWLRLYPCDLKPGSLDAVMDRIVNRGYNRVYVEVFYDGQVLLPPASNPTAWPSVIRNTGTTQADLLAQAIQKGHERGLGVYAWMFTMNFGYSYGQRPDRQQVLARNGQGSTSLYIAQSNGGLELSVGEIDKIFIDPYNLQAKQDYNRLVQAVLQRKPDGVLFDYIRYPRQTGTESVATGVEDLWIHSSASRQALSRRALNYKGFYLIQRFLERGRITGNDIASLDRLYPNEGEPLWQGRSPNLSGQTPLPMAIRQPRLQRELWLLSAAHAFQGVLDFLAAAVMPVRQQRIPAGAVFFPDGNRRVGQGFDSRMQPWQRFPGSLEWHPMAYGLCGNTRCIVDQVQTVLRAAPPGTQVSPVIAGVWGRSINGQRPSLEAQMYAIRQAAPQIKSVSHFAYSWQEDPQSSRERRFCTK